MGDAGFIINKDNISSNVNLIVPFGNVYARRAITVKRKNQKEQNTEDDKAKLKNRYKIENLFSKIKRFNRIHVRRDKLIVSFMGFVYMAVIAPLGRIRSLREL